VRIARRLSLLSATLCLLAPGVAIAGRDDSADGNHSHRAGLGELLGDNWEALLAFPADQNPFIGNGDPCLMLKRHILAPAGASASCPVKPGTRVFLWYSTECSDVERGTVFFAVGEAAQAECARALDEATVQSLQLTIDGRTREIRKPRFEVISRQRTVDLPANNILSGAAERATFVAHGWALLTRPLRPGQHVITTTLNGDVIATYTINVVGRHQERSTD
jgi:hypothetical protein